MTVYADTNFFSNAYLELTHQGEAEELAGRLRDFGAPAFQVTWLVRFELINTLQNAVFLTRSKVPGISVTPEMTLRAEAQFFEDLAGEAIMREADLALDAVGAEFEALVHRHTARHGFRTYDLLHVTSALLLGCDTFWSFDAKAKKLAKLEGLQTN